MAEAIIAAGYRKIAFLGTMMPYDHRARKRLQGFEAALRQPPSVWAWPVGTAIGLVEMMFGTAGPLVVAWLSRRVADAQHLRVVVGPARDLEAERRIHHGGIDVAPHDIVEMLLDRVVAQLREAVPWRPGARELLAAVVDAGIPTALVTMSWRRRSCTGRSATGSRMMPPIGASPSNSSI